MDTVDVLIVSKTRMWNGVCVGGIDIYTGESIRLHDEYGRNLDNDAPYEIGEIWRIECGLPQHPRPKPHVEDRRTSPIKRIDKKSINIIRVVLKRNSKLFGSKFTEGSLDLTFEGNLVFWRNKAYISKHNVPSFSTQFWVCDDDLVLETNEFGKEYYNYQETLIPFVGFQDKPATITKGTILRLSLANWWSPNDTEERCYLQISGYY